MKDLRAVDLDEAMRGVRESGKGRRVLWQDSESIAFLSRGRKLRTAGEQRLHYLTPEADEKVAVIRPGQMLLCPGGVPHSPRVGEDAWFVVFERKRRAGEQDRFLWRCERCAEKVYEVAVEVGDYSLDPVSRVHETFYGDERLRTCKSCGNVVPRP
jgi:3-hydroxyanthranilate 3,4-dioxygenase